MKQILCGISLWAFLLNPLIAGVSGDQLQGVWLAEAYVIGGVEHPMRGVMFFSGHYFSANIVYNTGDSNANAGTFEVKGDGQVVFQQWIQLHVRQQKPEESFLKENVPEAATCRLEKDRLSISFPSGNLYRLKRAAP